jgi:hypothetical protein
MIRKLRRGVQPRHAYLSGSGGKGFKEARRFQRGIQRVIFRINFRNARERSEIMLKKITISFMEEYELTCEGVGNKDHHIQPK